MSTPTLPEFEGREVDRATIRFAGVGTGLSEGLKVAPIVLEPGDEAYFVLRVTCSGVSHDEDADELLVRSHKVKAADMAPIDEATAAATLAAYRTETTRRKDEIAGQLTLDDEAAAAEREQRDGTAPPDEVATDAAERVKAGQ